jgi:hypothetical protein
MDASLEACPPPAGAGTDPAAPLVALTKTDLAGRLDLSADQIRVQSVTPAEFPDASLGVPEKGKVYAQVITPGYVIELAIAGQTHRYHASGEQIVAVPSEEGQTPSGRITIEGVEVSDEQVIIHGTSTLPDGTRLSTELWADGAMQTWWSTDACAPIRQGAWELVVPLEAGQALEPGVQYMVRAYQPGGPNIVATFPFDLDGPPSPASGEGAVTPSAAPTRPYETHSDRMPPGLDLQVRPEYSARRLGRGGNPGLGQRPAAQMFYSFIILSVCDTINHQ